jgi:hypothetical protein
VRRLGFTLAVLVFAGAPGAQDRPLPEASSFLAHVRAHLRTDRALLSQYTYLEHRREVRLSKLGKVELGERQVFQVYPGLDRDDTYRRLIEVDGKPRDPRELETEDRKHQKHVLEEVQKREHESAADRAKRAERAAKDRREEDEMLDDVTRVYTFTLVERQMRNGQPMIVVAFVPRRDAAPKTENGKLMTKIRGRGWVSESDYEVARVEFEMLDDLSVGMVLGKIYKGTTGSLDRRKVNDEVWLPAEARFNGSGRALVRKFHIETVIEFSDYKKFSVETDTAFKIPK